MHRHFARFANASQVDLFPSRASVGQTYNKQPITLVKYLHDNELYNRSIVQSLGGV